MSIKVDPLTVKSCTLHIAPPTGALLLIKLELEIVTLGLPFAALISIAPPSTSAELLMNFEFIILMVPAQISIAPPYWALLLVNLVLLIVPVIALSVLVTSIAAPLLSFGVILPLPDAVLLSNTQLVIVNLEPSINIPAPYNPPFLLNVESLILNSLTFLPDNELPEVVIAPPQRPELLTK